MENNLDKLFKSKLEGQEPEFHPAAWDRMEGLLDDEGLVPRQKNKPRRGGFIFLSILLLGMVLSIVGYNKLNPSLDVSEGSTLTNTIKENDRIANINNNSINSSSDIVSAQSNENIKRSQITESEINHNSTFKNSLVDDEINALDIDHKIQDKATSKILQSKAETNENRADAIDVDGVGNDEKVDILSTEILSTSTEQKEEDKQFTEDYSNSSLSSEVTKDSKLESEGALNLADEEMNNVGVTNLAEFAAPMTDETRFLRIEFLNTIPLVSLDWNISDNLISPEINVLPYQKTENASKFEIGILATSRLNNGLGYAIGPCISYNVGNGFSLGVGGQFDVQKFNNGPEITVIDKSYSFGSTLNERKFSMNQQKSIRLPVTLSKLFGQIGLSAGLVYYQALESSGEIAASSDGSSSLGMSIDNDLIKSQNVSFQLETSFTLNRYFRIGLGLEYKPKAFSADQSISNNQNTYYPTAGIRYTFFKY